MGACVIRDCGFKGKEAEGDETERRMIDGGKKIKIGILSNSETTNAEENYENDELDLEAKRLEQLVLKQDEKISQFKEEIARTQEPLDKEVSNTNYSYRKLFQHLNSSELDKYEAAVKKDTMISSQLTNSQKSSKQHIGRTRNRSEDLRTSENSNRRKPSREALRDKIEATTLTELHFEKNILLAKSLLVKEKSEKRNRSSDKRTATSTEKSQNKLAENNQKKKSLLEKKEIIKTESIEKSVAIPVIRTNIRKSSQVNMQINRNDTRIRAQSNPRKNPGETGPRVNVESDESNNNQGRKIIGFENQFFKAQIKHYCQESVPSPIHGNILINLQTEEDEDVHQPVIIFEHKRKIRDIN